MKSGQITLGWKNACAAVLFCTLTASASLAQTFNTLADFYGKPSPRAPLVLIQGFDGNFYGTTSAGVASGQCKGYYCGTIFKMTPKGGLTTLHNFCTEVNCPDGQLPSSLLQATDGNFYGTTLLGGSGCAPGTLFRMTPSGKFTTLHSFCGSDGVEPRAQSSSPPRPASSPQFSASLRVPVHLQPPG